MTTAISSNPTETAINSKFTHTLSIFAAVQSRSARVFAASTLPPLVAIFCSLFIFCLLVALCCLPNINTDTYS